MFRPLPAPTGTSTCLFRSALPRLQRAASCSALGCHTKHDKLADSNAAVRPTLCRHGVAHLAGVSAEMANSVFEIETNRCVLKIEHSHSLPPRAEHGYSIRIKYGGGALREVGNAARYAFGLKRVALMTDARVRQLPFFDTVHKSLLLEVMRHYE